MNGQLRDRQCQMYIRAAGRLKETNNDSHRETEIKKERHERQHIYKCDIQMKCNPLHTACNRHSSATLCPSARTSRAPSSTQCASQIQSCTSIWATGRDDRAPATGDEDGTADCAPDAQTLSVADDSKCEQDDDAPEAVTRSEADVVAVVVGVANAVRGITASSRPPKQATRSPCRRRPCTSE